MDVALANMQLASNSYEAAQLEEKAAVTRKTELQAHVKGINDAKKHLIDAKKELAEHQADEAAATKEVEKLKNLNLKSLLSNANEVLSGQNATASGTGSTLRESLGSYSEDGSQ